MPETGALHLDHAPSFERQFDLLATSHGGVGRLRELILTMAIQGRLVAQDPTEETAVRLLERARAEKQRLVSDGMAARPRPVEPVSREEMPFDLPVGWSWARLPDVCYDFGQRAPTSDFTYIDVGSIDNDRARITDSVPVLPAKDAPSRARKLVQQGTVLYSTVRPYLKNIAIVERAYTPRAIASTAFAVIHPHQGISGKYLLYYLRSETFTQFVATKMVGVAYPAINDGNFFQAVIAVPPASEQLRIVARVDELMRLCDALEAKGRLEAEQHSRLLSTLLGTLTDSRSPEELAANWQRVADNFDLLLDRPQAVDALENEVLRLAVRGLLLHQTNTGRGEGVRLYGDTPSRLPSGWRQVRVGDVVQMLNGYAFKSEWFTTDGIRLVRNANVGHGQLDWRETACISAARLAEFAQFSLTEGDLVLSLDRPIISTGLKIARIRRGDLPCLLLQRVARLKPDAQVLTAEFLVLWLLSDQFVDIIDPGRSNGVPHISTKQVSGMILWMPPVDEQRRIVARVNELRRLCADLRQRLTTQQTTQARLAEALVASATSV